MTHRLGALQARFRFPLRGIILGLGVGTALSVACTGFNEMDDSCVYDADCIESSSQCSPSRCVDGFCKNMPSEDPACAESTGDDPSIGSDTIEPTTMTETTTDATMTTVEPTTASETDTSTTVDPDSTGTTGGGNGVCGSDYTHGSPEVDACATATCCPEFDACNADPACAECLAQDPPGKNCIEQPAFGEYQACVFFGCPESLCMSPVVVEDRGGGPDFECHACMFQPCCGEAQFCLQDPTGCEACLAEEDPLVPQSAECQAATLQVQQGAALIHECAATNCAAECPGL